MSMSVGELIKKLQEFDSGLEVAVQNYHGILDAVSDVYEEQLPDEMRYSDEPERCVVIS